MTVEISKKEFEGNLDKIIRNRLFGGVVKIDFKYKYLVEYVDSRTPTSYGSVEYEYPKNEDEFPELDLNLKSEILLMISSIQRQDNNSLILSNSPEDFIFEGETLIKRFYGSSASHLLLVHSKKMNNSFIRKVGLRTGVEGNGIPKLKAEGDFLEKISKQSELKGLSCLYPKLYKSYTINGNVVVDMELIGDGSNFFNLLLDRSSEVGLNFAKLMDRFLDQIITDGYNINSELVPTFTSFEQLEDYYLRRAEARILYLENNTNNLIDFSAKKITNIKQLLKRKTVLINGEKFKNPLDIINKIRINSKLRDVLRPRIECFCAHGDLTFLNTVYDKGNKKVRLIDSRGHFGNWDPIYDFGKLKFTLSGFGNIVNKRLELTEETNGNFLIRSLNEFNAQFFIDSLNTSFLDLLSQNNKFIQLIQNEPYWKQRILFAEAIHYLADIPHRLLIDGSVKNATLLFLIGTKLLNHFYDANK